MSSISVLSVFNIMVLLQPPQFIADMLNLMPLPFSGRIVLLFGVVINVVVSMAFEEWGAGRIAGAVSTAMKWRRGRRRARKAYKVVEGGMR